MNATRQTNTFSGGLSMDVDYSVLKDNQYIYAENIRILTNEGSSFAAMQNIEGFLACRPSSNLSGETIIHVTTVRDWAIVFTKINGTNNNNVYRIDFSRSQEEPIVTKVVTNRPLDIEVSSSNVAAISSVCRWEASNNVKVYWADGHSQIKVINVDDDHISSNSSITSDTIVMLPKATLPPFEFNGFGTGSLESGMIQYCYQLFKVRGTESAISPLTPLYHLSDKDQKTNYNAVRGSSKGQNTGKSIKLQVRNNSTGFDRVRIISLFYKAKNEVPVISIVDDIVIGTGSVINYEDKGGSLVSELSIDEFNSLANYTFIPEVIESKDNRLFAANLTEETWDVEYDARAFRANSSGNVLLLSNSGSSLNFALSALTTTNIPKDHDCICPFNVDGSAYKYTTSPTGGYIQGGKGKNVSYRFITTDLLEDGSTTSRGMVNEEFTFNASSRSLTSLDINYEGNDKSNSISLSSGNKIPNYSNAEIESKVKGYMRDEIYRFGIVLYNKQGLASPVHWIGDIRMPSNKDTGYKFFTSNEASDYGSNLSVVTKPLGIEFEVKNLPSDVVRYEIVRCERTLSDRTILAQGVVSCITNYDRDSNILTPFPYLAYSNKHGYYAKTHNNGDFQYTFNLSDTQSNNYFMFVSPEIAVNRENADALIDKFQTVEKVGYMTSPITADGDWGITEAGATKVLANARSIKYDGTTIKPTKTLGNQPSNGYVSGGCVVINNDDFYAALLAKYYGLYVESGVQSAAIESAKYAGPSSPWLTNGDQPWYNAEAVTIGDKVYYNWVWDNIKTAGDGEVDNTDANNVRKYGPHGICAIFKSDNMISNISLASGSSSARYLNAVALCNIKQSVNAYGGNSYSAVQNSVYITTGASAESSVSTVLCYGGDTYLNIFDYNNCMFSYNTDDYYNNKSNRLFLGAFIPCESSVNLALTHADSSINRTYQAGDGYANHFVEDDIVTVGDLYTQNTPSYAYNDAYSAQPNAKKFVAKSIYNIDNLLTDTRIISSELKTNNEVTDSWTKFKVANYLDVDTRFGPINDMKLFKNNLVFWQTDAFGTVAVNERSIITDNNPGALTLGVGGILDRYDYFTTMNGESPNQLRANTQSDSTVYWYDSKRNEICGFNGQLQTVSKLKGVQSYLNKNKDLFKKDPIAVYDKKYNEVLFTLGDKTLAFNEQLGVFTSFYNYNPDYYAEFSDKLYLFKSLKLFKYNGGEQADLDSDKAKVSEIEFVVNKDYPQTKTFDNVEYSGNFTTDTNFDLILFTTKRQTSETLTSEDIDYREDTYKFAIPRNSLKLNEVEQLANKSYKDRMKGKYLICNYKYDCNGGNKFKVPYISTAYRYSMI